MLDGFRDLMLILLLFVDTKLGRFSILVVMGLRIEFCEILYLSQFGGYIVHLLEKLISLAF